MRLADGMRRLLNPCIVVCLALSPLAVGSGVEVGKRRPIGPSAQESHPDVPGDVTKIYYAAAENELAPLPFEKGITSVNAYAVAEADKASEVRLDGPKAATLLNDPNPSFYVFVAEGMDPPPHLLIRLTSKKASRRFTITRTKGRKGYSPLSEENIRLDYRILERLSVQAGKGRILFINYMEIRPRQPLAPGEYAIAGNSLADIATFSVK
jgi:hypothetical protein